MMGPAKPQLDARPQTERQNKLTQDNKGSKENNAAGRIQSLWLATTPDTNYSSLSEDLSVDVAVLGGGIAGVTSALLLTEAGLKVVLLEAGRIARGITAHTAGKITSLQQLLYSHLISSFGQEKAQMYADANQSAIEQVAAFVEEQQVPCQFLRRPAYTYAETAAARLLVEEEVKAALSLNLPASIVETVPLPFDTLGAISFAGQAQFHPRKYLLALADRFIEKGGRIYEKTRALQIGEEGPFTVTTAVARIKARDVVICTHAPFHDPGGFYRAHLFPFRTYMLAARMNEDFPAGMFIGSDDFGHSLRAYKEGQTEFVLIGGEDHPAEQTGGLDHHRELAKFASHVYESPSLEYRWAGQYNNTVDRVPYIGRFSPENRHLLVATGFGGWGMTNGTVAGLIFRDLILKGVSPWGDVYDPGRLR
jgi:glycine/D-amino acid oxidase-like deaminating enzyme